MVRKTLKRIVLAWIFLIIITVLFGKVTVAMTCDRPMGDLDRLAVMMAFPGGPASPPGDAAPLVGCDPVGLQADP